MNKQTKHSVTSREVVGRLEEITQESLEKTNKTQRQIGEAKGDPMYT